MTQSEATQFIKVDGENMPEETRGRNFIERIVRNSFIRQFGNEREETLISWFARIVSPALAVGLAGALSTDFCLHYFTNHPVVAICVLAAAMLVFALIPVLIGLLKLIAISELHKTFDVSVIRSESIPHFNKIDAQDESPEDIANRKAGKVLEGPFARCSAAALRATKSIHVIGPHFPGPVDAGHGANPTTNQHDVYLETAMTSAMERHTLYDPQRAQEGRQFKYVRIVQIDRSATDFQEVRQKAEIEGRLIGNEPLRNHVKDVLEAARLSNGSLDVNVWVRQFVPSMPSILVIDERLIFFSLPSYEVAEQAGELKMGYNFVLEIDDKSQNIARHFVRMISQMIDSDSVRIHSVR